MAPTGRSVGAGAGDGGERDLSQVCREPLRCRGGRFGVVRAAWVDLEVPAGELDQLLRLAGSGESAANLGDRDDAVVDRTDEQQRLRRDEIDEGDRLVLGGAGHALERRLVRPTRRVGGGTGEELVRVGCREKRQFPRRRHHRERPARLTGVAPSVVVDERAQVPEERLASGQRHEHVDHIEGRLLLTRVELTALCSDVEHLLGLHAQAHHRLVALWEELPADASSNATTLTFALALDRFYQADYTGMQHWAVLALTGATSGTDNRMQAAAASLVARAGAFGGETAEGYAE